MTEFLIYNGKVAILLAVFYLFFRLLMERETFHRLNRAVLLLSILVSFILPFCIITTHQVIQVAAHLTNQQTTPSAVAQNGSVSYWPAILLAVWLFGVVAKLAQTAFSTYRLTKFIHSCEQRPQKDGTVIAVSSQDLAPFSWWNTIVLSRTDYEVHDPALIVHEKAHIKGYHSIDTLLMEVLLAVQWFNPAAWLMSRDLRAVHEYEADDAVLSNGLDAHHYLTLLMQRSLVKGNFLLANAISQKMLKDRFMMMSRKHSRPSRVFKILYVVPIVCCTLALNARTVVETQYIQTELPTDETNAELPTEEEQTVKAPKPAARLERHKVETGQVTISGVVQDIDGNPIVGAAIMERNAKHGTVTDFDGRFSITVPQGATIDAMYIGVATESVVGRKDQTDVRITLKPDGSDKEE